MTSAAYGLWDNGLDNIVCGGRVFGKTCWLVGVDSEGDAAMREDDGPGRGLTGVGGASTMFEVCRRLA